jgi:phosphate transport system substrate-binding protein
MMFLVGAIMCLIVMPTHAQETLRYSCSAQIVEAFGSEGLDEFTRETGIKVDLYVSSSAAAVYRLMNGSSDIASAARELHFRFKEFGYLEIPFCKDPLAVIANKHCPIDNLTESQLRDIFSGDVTNWNKVGGPDQPIVVIVPGKITAAYRNFERMVMDGKEIWHDLISHKSTMVIRAVEHIPWSLSFISQGAAKDRENLKIIGNVQKCLHVIVKRENSINSEPLISSRF